MPARRFVLTFLLACVCLLASCGAEGPPKPPRVQRPARVNDLAVAQAGKVLRLSFDAPQLATDGRRLTKPIEVEIYRQIAAPGHPASGPSGTGQAWMEIKSDEMARFEHGRKIVYDDKLSPQQFNASIGAVFSFAVITLTRGFRGRARKSDLSNLARMRLLNVSPPVENVRVAQKQKCLELQWSQPARGLSEQPLPALTGYRVYRSEDGRTALAEAWTATTGPFYCDSKFEFHHTYFYRVRAVFRQDGTTAETADSKTAAVTPREIFPPPPPAGLEAVYSTTAVELIWKPGPAPKVEGYYVYREGPQGRVTRLNKTLLRIPVFEDRTVRSGLRYVYWVTAVDAAGNESLPSIQAITETR
ncbi:MAG: fibronectin type III domain-containing protein [Terriglobia bacterium]